MNTATTFIHKFLFKGNNIRVLEALLEGAQPITILRQQGIISVDTHMIFFGLVTAENHGVVVYQLTPKGERLAKAIKELYAAVQNVLPQTGEV